MYVAKTDDTQTIIQKEEIEKITSAETLAFETVTKYLAKLDVTTLADASRQYIEGIKDYGDLEFTFIYESGAEGNYAQLNGLEGQQDCVVTFPDGSKFSFKGEVSLRIVGVGVNAVITFVMAVALSSDIVYAPAAN